MGPEMLAKNGFVFIALLTAIGAVAAPASADDNGLAYMHDLRSEGGRSCFLDHFHYGSGAGATRNAAQRDAISSWQSFTAFEYGTDWARFGRAASKQISCSKSASGYDCSLNARPCK